MKSNPIIRVLSAAAIGFCIGISFPIQITPKVFPLGFGDGNCASGGRNSAPFRNNSSTSTAEGTPPLQPNATSKTVPPAKPKGAERLPPNIVVGESDLHLRRLWGLPHEDTPTRKYLLVLTVGYSEKANVNATVHKFSENFDVVLFHYDGETTEWDGEFAWSKAAVHVGARGQTKWWYAKRFLHPAVVAPYDYIFLWDEDLGVEAFDAEEYLEIVRRHGLEISQPALDATRSPVVPYFDITARRNGSEMHRSTLSSPADKCESPPCSGFVEVMAPVFSREAWTCVWHMVQNDLVHGFGLDWNFWRCVHEPEEHIGVVDAQYVVHHAVVTLGREGESRSDVRARQRDEFSAFNDRMSSAERAQTEAALLVPPPQPAAAASAS